MKAKKAQAKPTDPGTGKVPDSGESEKAPPAAETKTDQPPAPSAADVETLRARAAERDAFLDQLQRARAELANYQRRVERDRETWSQEAVARFVARLIPFLDDVERGLRAVGEGKDFSSVERGLSMMERSFRSLLVDQGVQPIDTAGAPFDPRLHEAIAQRVTSDCPDGTVVEELRKGYLMGGKVLRPAQVIVSRLECEEADGAPAPDLGEPSKEEES